MGPAVSMGTHSPGCPASSRDDGVCKACPFCVGSAAGEEAAASAAAVGAAAGAAPADSLEGSGLSCWLSAHQSGCVPHTGFSNLLLSSQAEAESLVGHGSNGFSLRRSSIPSSCSFHRKKSTADLLLLLARAPVIYSVYDRESLPGACSHVAACIAFLMMWNDSQSAHASMLVQNRVI